jgi:acrylyl-CoA reductase (NADPH)
MKALVIRENANGVFTKSIEEKGLEELPNHEVCIKVHYAGLNFKDALSSSGHKGITRKFPHTPGVDAAGEVVSDASGTFQPGEKVLCTSYDFGMNTSGGFQEYVKVPTGWVVRLPESITLEESMIMGTAAYTAALALYKMEKAGQHPDMGEIVVTGAGGGVGTMALAILRKAGYRAVAASGKKDHYAWLEKIGAARCIGREEVSDQSGKPILSSRWAGAIDNVGGNTLSTLLKGCAKEGCVASIGLVDSPQFDITVYPFILNGVSLLGIDSADTRMNVRTMIWQKLASDWKPELLQEMKTIVTLEEIPSYIEKMLKGETLGRIVAKLV